ncbi:polyprenyl diphosphate synthase [Chondromyces apiculatus]|uniref:Isoprenyl transferase n=1 Tax=Chondromyces apiculatus DSM 436 TaxID=1192034 RepID=A0A017T2I2_9BACT|nr:polyprenyl diphosphate synthase [Chondromyces apiculatus]EYF03469.1 Undecaprenyl pyrophosphate synthetase [Chondromyces apiculatus DSM 436]
MAHPNLPRHIAIILDGNGRWATTREFPRTRGHEEGLKAVRLSVRACRERGIQNLTLYAFSVANWSRPKEEIDGLMRVCLEFAQTEVEECVRRGVAVQVIGDLDDLPTPTRRAVEQMVEATRDGKAMTLALALSYGGRRDMVNAMRALAARAQAGLVIPEEINEASLRGFLTTSELPDPDLIIRTGGEKRLSDFLLFESAYAELFFSDVLWPDFDEPVLDQALAAFSRRQRRYGRTGDQVTRAALP